MVLLHLCSRPTVAIRHIRFVTVDRCRFASAWACAHGRRDAKISLLQRLWNMPTTGTYMWFEKGRTLLCPWRAALPMRVVSTQTTAIIAPRSPGYSPFRHVDPGPGLAMLWIRLLLEWLLGGATNERDGLRRSRGVRKLCLTPGQPATSTSLNPILLRALWDTAPRS